MVGCMLLPTYSLLLQIGVIANAIATLSGNQSSKPGFLAISDTDIPASFVLPITTFMVLGVAASLTALWITNRACLFSIINVQTKVALVFHKVAVTACKSCVGGHGCPEDTNI